jgi:hypothetical protein
MASPWPPYSIAWAGGLACQHSWTDRESLGLSKGLVATGEPIT